LEQALIDREQVLARLHTTVHAHAGDDDESTTAHEQLWEVQRVVTLIKRHLRQVVASAPVEQPSSAPLAGAADNAVLTTNDTTGVGSSDFVDCEFSASGVVACARSYAAAAGGAAVDTGPCVEIYEEKHLIAVNDEVREKLAMERRSINRLLRQIHQETTRQQQSGVSSIINISVGDGTGGTKTRTCLCVQATPAVCVGGDDDMSTDWASVYADEVERHERLLADVIEETQHVARLRALIEVRECQGTHTVQQGFAFRLNLYNNRTNTPHSINRLHRVRIIFWLLGCKITCVHNCQNSVEYTLIQLLFMSLFEMCRIVNLNAKHCQCVCDVDVVNECTT
jgi:hypothetical protein